MGDFKKRVVTALVAGPCVVLLFAFLPPAVFLLFMAAVLALSVYEGASMARADDVYVAVAFAVVSLVPLYLHLSALWILWILFSPALYLLAKMVRPVQGYGSVNERIGTFVIVLLLSEVFLGLPLFAFYRLKEVGRFLPVCLLLIIWGSDTAAYLAGKSMGRHKLAPHVSPKKTVEGLIGAMVGAALVTLLFGRYMGMTPLAAVVVGLAIGLLGQFGDMLESIAKRVCKVKDSSSLIPGHGGILDRIDSFLLTAPFLYYYLSGLPK